MLPAKAEGTCPECGKTSEFVFVGLAPEDAVDCPECGAFVRADEISIHHEGFCPECNENKTPDPGEGDCPVCGAILR